MTLPGSFNIQTSFFIFTKVRSVCKRETHKLDKCSNKMDNSVKKHLNICSKDIFEIRINLKRPTIRKNENLEMEMFL
jgi:hypothetical protein